MPRLVAAEGAAGVVRAGPMGSSSSSNSSALCVERDTIILIECAYDRLGKVRYFLTRGTCGEN